MPDQRTFSMAKFASRVIRACNEADTLVRRRARSQRLFLRESPNAVQRSIQDFQGEAREIYREAVVALGGIMRIPAGVVRGKVKELARRHGVPVPKTTQEFSSLMDKEHARLHEIPAAASPREEARREAQDREIEALSVISTVFAAIASVNVEHFLSAEFIARARAAAGCLASARSREHLRKPVPAHLMDAPQRALKWKFGPRADCTIFVNGKEIDLTDISGAYSIMESLNKAGRKGLSNAGLETQSGVSSPHKTIGKMHEKFPILRRFLKRGRKPWGKYRLTVICRASKQIQTSPLSSQGT